MPPSSTSKTAPSQPSQPSRRGKKAWRKNVDISAVQTGLENLREEIIQHGRPLAEKKQNELFALDTVGSSKEDVLHKAKEGRKRVLKIDEILGRRSAVPALETGKKRPLDARVTDGVLATKRQKTDWVSKKEVARLRSHLDKTSHLDIENIDNETSNFDLWDTTNHAIQHNSTSTATTQTEQDKEYIPKPKPKVVPSSLRRPAIALTQTGVPTHAVPAPDAGQSYNPSFEDWDSLLTREGEKEIQAERKRLQNTRIAAEKEARVQALAAQPDREPGEEGESEWEGFETETDVNEAEMKRRKRPERKTLAQRNKLKRRKEAEKLAKHQAKMGDRARRGEEIVNAMIAQQERQQDLETSAQQPTTTSVQNTTLRRKTTLGPSAASIPSAPSNSSCPKNFKTPFDGSNPKGTSSTTDSAIFW